MPLPWSFPFGRWLCEEYIAEGGAIPRWHGVAWACPYSHRVYCLPIPLNKIAGWCRNVWLRLKEPANDTIFNAWQSGRSAGLQQGYDQGMHQGIRLTLTAQDTAQRTLK